MKAIILAGGSGTRLWPLSRKSYPKQFLRLDGDKSLLQQTIERLLSAISIEDIIVITGHEYKFHVLSDLNALSLVVPNLILEPVSRNTAPAIALGIKYCMERLGCSEDEVIFVSPSDHIIRPVDKFREYLIASEEIAKKGYIVTFGIKPSRPETGYGYIKVKKEDLKEGYEIGRFFKVEEFTEKPGIETAERYIKEGNYYWNSGMFAFTIGTMLEELIRYAPNIGKMLDMSFEEMLSNFEKMPNISIDYAIMERSERVVTQPLDLYWNDIGSWDSLAEVFPKDERGNIKIGDVIDLESSNTIIIGNKRLIATIGLEDCMVIETDDAVLVAKRGCSQKVRDIVEKLKSANRKEVLEHVTTYRPWGSFTLLEEGKGYRVRRVVINPKESLSLQMHRNRSEHWVVIKGKAKVRIGDKEMIVHEGESVYVPEGRLHRLENPMDIPLEIIEVQRGEYLGEDDIVRYDEK